MNVALSPLDFLERARRLFGSLEAVADGDRRLTYADYAGRCHRLAHLLVRELGVQPGDRVAYLCGNSLGLASRDAEAAVLAALEQWKQLAIDGWLAETRPWFSIGEELRYDVTFDDFIDFTIAKEIGHIDQQILEQGINFRRVLLKIRHVIGGTPNFLQHHAAQNPPP